MAGLTAPWRTPEDDRILGDNLEALLQHLEDVAFDPPDFLRNAVDFGVVPGARENLGVFLDCKNLVPAPGERERDCIATCAGESVNEDRL